MGKKMTVLALWLISCVVCALAGWLGHRAWARSVPLETNSTRLSPDLIAQYHPLQEGKAEIYLKSESGRVLANLGKGAGAEPLSSAAFYDRDEKQVLCVFQYPDGAVKEIILLHRGQSRYDWRFSETGTPIYSTIYKDDTGTRQHYGPDGTPTHTSKIILHHGS